jgi:undecaprenyl-diphosphatase
MDIQQAMVLAAVQGATEFIPVSSSGHLVLVREFFGWSDVNGVFVDVVLHAASLLAIFTYFFRDWLGMITGVLRWRDPGGRESRREVGLLLLATVPIVLFGPFLEGYMGVFRRGGVIGVIMLATALWFFVCERWHRGWRERLGAGSAAAMGIAQVFALLPGASRSGLTISSGLLCGQQRARAARFSFLMVAPTIVGAVLLESAHISAENARALLLPMSIGFAVCFTVSLLCIHLCLRLFRRYTLTGFGVYLFAMGMTLLIVQWVA